METLSRLTDVDLVGFISTPDRPKGRSGRDTANPFASYLEKTAVKVSKPTDQSDLVALLRELRPDLVVVIAYGRLVRKEALAIPTHGWINLHFSLLPRFRGAAPVQRALEQGVNEFGFSIFQLDEGMDSGPIYLQGLVEVSPQACATEILDQLSIAGAASFPKVLEMIDRGDSPTRQEGTPSLAPKFNKDDTRLDLSKSGRAILDQIRAFTRIPGVWTFLDGKRVVITNARLADQSIEAGHMLLQEGRLILGLEDVGIEIRNLIPEGRREMTGGEFARGLRMEEGVIREVQVT